MKNYKHLIQIEEQYHIKQPLGLALVFIILFVLIGICLIFLTEFYKAGWIILSILALFFILSKTTHKSTKKIVIENEIPKTIEFRFAKFRKPIVYQIKDIRRFTIRKIYYVRIPISIELLAELETNGKKKNIMLSQSMSAKMIQELHEEIEDVLRF